MKKENSEEAGWRGFLELCVEMKNLKDFDALLNLFLTAEERVALATRFLIVRELLKGEKTQREMAKVLKVSIAKITRGSNFLKTISPDLKKLLKNLC